MSSVHERRNQLNREVAAAKKAAGLTYPVNKIPREVWEARIAEIPQDTRDLTARICGDPLRGRSALDRRASDAR